MSKAEIRQMSGKPTLYVNDQCTAPVLYALSDFPGAAANTAYAQKNIAAFAQAGVRLVAADMGLHISWRKTTGFEPGREDPSASAYESALLVAAGQSGRVHPLPHRGGRCARH